jgi:hypothetical protein
MVGGRVIDLGRAEKVIPQLITSELRIDDGPHFSVYMNWRVK